MFFPKPLSEITIEDLHIFCSRGVPEGFHLDYKEDFPTGEKLAKTIAAFANTFGGLILVGVEENDEGKPIMPLKGIPFTSGLELKVTNIILGNMSPPVFPEISVVRFRKAKKESAVVLIDVPQSDQTPHAIDNKSGIYVRTENRTSLEEVATVEQIVWLINKRQKSEALRRSMYSAAEQRLADIYFKVFKAPREKSSQQVLGQGIFSISPVYPSIPLIDVVSLKSLCDERDLIVKDYFGMFNAFPKFPNSPKTIQSGVVNYFRFDKSSPWSRDTFFYEMNIFGLFFYQEVFVSDFAPPKEQDSQSLIPTFNFLMFLYIARLDQFLEVAQLLYQKIAFRGLLEIKIQLNNILQLIITKPTGFLYWENDYIAHERSITIERRLTLQELQSKRMEVLLSIVNETFLAFNFEDSKGVVEWFLKKNARI